MADVSLQAKGCTLSWSAPFRRAMKLLCVSYGMPAAIPASVAVFTVKPKGLLLIRPAGESDQAPVPVRVSPRGRRITTQVADSFAELGITLPDGIVIDVPAVPYQCPRHGRCLALQFSQGTFLYRQSKGSAIALLDD